MFRLVKSILLQMTYAIIILFCLKFHSRTTPIAFFFFISSLNYFPHFFSLLFISSNVDDSVKSEACTKNRSAHACVGFARYRVLFIHCIQKKIWQTFCPFVCFSFDFRTGSETKENGNYTLHRPKKMDLIFVVLFWFFEMQYRFVQTQ